MAAATPAINEKSTEHDVIEFPKTIDFIPNDDFTTADEDEFVCFTEPGSLYVDSGHNTMATGPGGYESSYLLPLLSPEGEAFLFRKMNYLRYRAAQLLKSGSGIAANSGDADELQRLLDSANAARNHIAECNLRLVISIARKFAINQSDFDELISEAQVILLKAIDKFDFSRGFRFSTYATNAVQRHFYRFSQQKLRRQRIGTAWPAEMLNEIAEANAAGTDDLESLVLEEERLKLLVTRMDECLNEREQFIIRERFGIGSKRATRTLRDIAQDVGLSKERVRQIQFIAIDKLRALFPDLRAEPAGM